MAQYVYTMHGVSKTVPPKRTILEDISLSFFPGAKIGVLGLNGAGKSTLLKIMAGLDDEFRGEARAAEGIRVGFLTQEPELDPTKDVAGNVAEGVAELRDLPVLLGAPGTTLGNAARAELARRGLRARDMKVVVHPHDA